MSYGSLGSEGWLQWSEVTLIGWWAVVSLGGDARARQFKVFLKLDEGMARPKKVWKWCQNWRALHILDGRATLWRDFSRLEKWAAGNMEYNLGKHQVPPLAVRSLVVVQNGAHGLRTTLEAQWAARGTMSSTDSPILIPRWSVFREHAHAHTHTRVCINSLPSMWPKWQCPPCCRHPDRGTPQVCIRAPVAGILL